MNEIASLKRKLDEQPAEVLTNLELYLTGASTLQTYFEKTAPLSEVSLQSWKQVFVNKDGESKLLMTEFFDSAECDYLFRLMEKLTLQKEPTFEMFPGKVCKMHRDVGFFSDSSSGYSYAKQTSEASPLIPELQRLIDLVNTLCKSKFNGILVNRYEPSGTINAHSDKEKELSKDVGVVALSVGAVRKMRFKDLLTKGEKARLKAEKKPQPSVDVAMPNGSLMCMFGKNFQQLYSHEIKAVPTKSAPLKKNEKTVRYSLTFRCHNK